MNYINTRFYIIQLTNRYDQFNFTKMTTSSNIKRGCFIGQKDWSIT